MLLHHMFFLHFRNSWKTCFRNKWTNILVRSFLWFKSLRYLSVWTSEVYSLCYRSQWYPAPSTTKTGWYWNDSYDTWNFPASQVIRAQTCKLLLYKLEVDTLSIFSNLQQAVIQKICFSGPMFIKHFLLVLWYRFAFCRFAHAVFFHPVHRT